MFLKNFLRQLNVQKNWGKYCLALILFFAGATRLWRLNYPTRYYFDEVYHVVTARLMAQNNPHAYEWWHPAPEPDTAIDWLHPPLAKLTQALSILVLGDQSFAWRFSSAIFGIGVIGLVYMLARKLKFDQKTALLAAGLASLDGLLLTMSRITMNDIHVTFFILLTWILYWDWKQERPKNKFWLVALSAGLATSSKWSGVFALLPMFFDLGLQLTTQPKWKVLKQVGQQIAWLIGGVIVVYFLSYSQMFLQGHDLKHWWQLHQQIWWYQTGLTATHPYQSVPWQWFFNARPVYTFVATSPVGRMTNMYIQGNSILFWSGSSSVLVSLAWLGFESAQGFNYLWQISQTKSAKQWQDQKKQFTKWQSTQLELINKIVFLLVAYFSIWIAWTNSPRIMFFYHYTPAVPILCLLLAYWLRQLSQNFKYGQILSYILLSFIALNFFVFYPNWTGLTVPQSWSEVYFFFDSWR